ncbi:hypothetical protein A2763_04610 [Candidatus Kaiserbacteria bacterium RIFCSPHIGHO2_01_FULL_54_36]|uniref:Uncharacterized protein n=1 Tax=Candidatus Kaiserbacteria bacterium RIFCSPHIGHO2_01_FULL_54_36 TaxID=1798482 RepID=A0A1F6CMH9_9BACT|nr:MAG: hypothetical protein A2763_04610 [Candidatus Kaiserbacteria bacterium RIFCSPHIGHO2_01_FULL_54_36]OGG75049.1 MAG: hypothetical protein A3A41_02040 [Candidatus Kaiserbacteria bacterium RIFCSPLOWO2_01_FULL_54_22]
MNVEPYELRVVTRAGRSHLEVAFPIDAKKDLRPACQAAHQAVTQFVSEYQDIRLDATLKQDRLAFAHRSRPCAAIVLDITVPPEFTGRRYVEFDERACKLVDDIKTAVLMH